MVSNLPGFNTGGGEWLEFRLDSTYTNQYTCKSNKIESHLPVNYVNLLLASLSSHAKERNDGIKDTEHLLLLCPSFNILRRDLLAGVSNLLRPFPQSNSFSNSALIQLLLYGNKDLSEDIDKDILQLTLNFIHRSGRFG